MKIKIGKVQVICIISGTVLTLLSYLMKPDFNAERYLKRNGYGNGETTYQIEVDGLAKDTQLIEIKMEEQIFSKEQMPQIFEEAVEYIKKAILMNNSSLSEVRTDLNLITSIPEMGITVSWISDDVDMINSFGKISLQEVTEAGKQVMITAHLRTGEYRYEKQLEITLLPPIKTMEESLVDQFKQELSILEEQEREKEGIILPGEYLGGKLTYRLGEAQDEKIFFVMGIILAFGWSLKEQNDKKRIKQNRLQQMQLDYSEVVYKFMIYIGAGLTVKKCWEQIVFEYDKRSHNNSRHIYEEMKKTLLEINNGLSETKAYQKFGQSCGLQSYLKLVGILEQNRKMGNKHLKQLLLQEVQDAFEMRKHLARKLGEEAGTKLLLPLFLLLGLIMAMVLIPSIWSML